ncbi:hypothetical protein DFH11DRAFT_1881304 [Phellopilus nigrolimitatus]|nr:hypothetical protein DFH11DRAFT_1881304 [Phellopilus nigrolimitatus]
MQGGDPAEAAFGELREADMNKGRQPDTWALSALVVADPFILTKNATGAIIARAVERFKEECRCAVLILDGGGEFDELLGDGENYGAARRGHTRRRGSAPILRGKRGSPEQGQGQGQQKDKNKNEGNDMNRVQDQDQRGDRSNSQSRSQSRNQDQQQKQKRTRSHSPVKDRPSSKGVDGKGKDYVTAGRGGGRGGRGRKGRGQSAPPVRARTPSEAAA